METVLEQQRRFHEERERLIDALTKEMLFIPKTHKEKVNSEHRQRYLYDRYLELTQELIDLYEDKYGIAKQDIAAISGPNEFNEFYQRLKNIKDFHKQHPGEINIPLSAEFEKFKDLRENPEEAGATIVQFSAEEGYGRFLDLHELYDQFINLKGIPKVDYLSYVGSFDRLFDIPKEKKTSYYKEYVDNLIGYLENFISRSMPMVDLRQEIRKTIEEFEDQWKSGKVKGWNKDAAPALSNTGAHLDLTAFTNWEELASLGLDRLKSALLALGLKCGGTLEERAKRLWATKGIQIEDIPNEFFAQKNAKQKILNPKLKKDDLTERQKEIAQLESITYCLSDLVKEQKESTIENIQRKQARGPSEREEDDSDAEEINNDNAVDGAEEDEDEDAPYNPKNLPLGWDGKPIPYWLYKLHGLNMYYSCEICGNQTYRGPKAFQRHFSEWRHAHGMRCLGIPNTAHFAHITKIEDALALWQTIRVNKESERWKADQEEEMEDAVGNVVSKKIFDDLKRQGLI